MSIKGLGWHSNNIADDKLTPQEQQVLKHIFMGHRNRAIAASLDVAEVTVRLYIYKILRKLGLERERELFPLAFQARAELAKESKS